MAYFTYDALGRVTKAEDEKGNVTCYEYTLNGNLAKVTDALGNETFYQYDAMGQLVQTSCTGTNGEEPQNTVYTWDKEGHVTTVTDALGDIERYTYDPAGKMRAKVDKDGYETTFHYGTNGQVEEICYADGRKVSLTYNAIRQLEEVKDWLGTTKIAMDEAGRIASVTDPYGKTVGYEWGSMGERTAVLYPDGKKNVYEYNEAMQMSAMKIFSGEMRENTIRYSYDEFGRLIGKQLPGGNYTDYRYNAAGKLEEILHKGADFTERCHYSYDVMGNKVMAEKERPGLPEDSGSFSYCYDALNRLTSVAQNGQTLRTYSYDAFGNRSSKTEYQTAGGLVTTYRYNTRNQLLQETNANGTKDYAYDHRGNLLSVTSDEEVLRAYGFDAANQMNSSMGMTDGQIKKAVYQYHGLGHRMEQSVAAGDAAPEQTIRYTLDLTRQYHNLLQKTENNVEQTYFWDGNVTGMEEEGREHFYFQDDLGSPMRLADEAGRSEETYGFDEFGNDIRTAKDIFKDSLQNFGFTGYQMDSAGGLYFAQARRYDAGAGRFISEDLIKGHIAVPYTMNHYSYCFNRPMDMVDLNGMWPSLKDIGEGIKSTLSSVAETVSDTAQSAVEGIKETASNVVDAGVDFVKEHREAVEIAVTVTVIAAIAVASVCTGGVAGAILAGTAVGATVGGVSGGLSNMMTGGSFANGVVGGAVNGGIVGAMTAIPGAGAGMGYIANFAGGFAGNMITEELNNYDGVNKRQEEILFTSAMTGIGQGLVGGANNQLGLANGIDSVKAGMSYYIWQAFSNLGGFSAGGCVYIVADYASKKIFEGCPASE